MVGKARERDITPKILEALDESFLSKKYWVAIGSDGPNVNKAINRELNKDVQASRGFGLLQIGTCSIHTLHNGFKKGSAFGETCDVGDLSTQIFKFFKVPGNWEDYLKVAPRSNRFINHLSGRWTTLGASAKLHILDAAEITPENF